MEVQQLQLEIDALCAVAPPSPPAAAAASLTTPLAAVLAARRSPRRHPLTQPSLAPPEPSPRLPSDMQPLSSSPQAALPVTHRHASLEKKGFNSKGVKDVFGREFSLPVREPSQQSVSQSYEPSQLHAKLPPSSAHVVALVGGRGAQVQEAQPHPDLLQLLQPTYARLPHLLVRHAHLEISRDRPRSAEIGRDSASFGRGWARD